MKGLTKDEISKAFKRFQKDVWPKIVQLVKYGMIQPSPNISAYESCAKGTYHFKKGDYESAFKWFMNGAMQKDKESLFMVGKMYHHAYGVSRNCRKALRYYKCSAKLGHVEGMYQTGMIYDARYQEDSLLEGIMQNREKCIMWLSRAAQRGHAGASNWIPRHTDRAERVYGYGNDPL